jgi:hypothetical protein
MTVTPHFLSWLNELTDSSVYSFTHASEYEARLPQ